MSSSVKERPATRVTVLDAIELDSEIERILKEKLLQIFQTLSPSLVKWEPELEAFLRLVVWKVSVHQLQSSFGQQILSVRYCKDISSKKAIVWALLAIGFPYLKQRIGDIVKLFNRHASTDQVSYAVGWLESSVQIASLLNLLVFLREGQFPSLPDRMTGLKTVSVDPLASRVVGYSFMTRELIWHGFNELIVFILPLVNYKYIQRCLAQLVGLRKTQPSSQQQGIGYSVTTKCALCQEPPVLPHHMGCSHVFCYYCLQIVKRNPILSDHNYWTISRCKCEEGFLPNSNPEHQWRYMKICLVAPHPLQSKNLVQQELGRAGSPMEG